jgi:hypothetical protein
MRLTRFDKFRSLFFPKPKTTSDLSTWLKLIEQMRQEGKLEADIIALVENHDISPTGHVVNHFTAEISSVAGDTLALLSHSPERNVAEAVREIVKWKTVACPHGVIRLEC